MSDPIQSSSSMQALTEQYRCITHNLANSNTMGFKRLSCEFRAVLDSVEQPAVQAAQTIDHTQGTLVQTGRALDLAIRGDGLFVLESPQGTFYTRNGTFLTNAQGQLVDTSGRTVVGQTGPIIAPGQVSASDLKVSEEGEVLANGQSIGRLKIVRFADRSVLQPAGGSLLKAPPDAPQQPAQSFEVRQGYLEASNVNVMRELVDLIVVSRLYEANAKAIATEDQRAQQLLQVAMA